MKEPAEAEGKPKRPAAEARGAAQKGVREEAAENPGAKLQVNKEPQNHRQRRGKAIETRRGAKRSRANRGSRK